METSTRRLLLINSHLTTQSNDILICAALRTPSTPAKTGQFSTLLLDQLLQQLFAELVSSTKINPTVIEDICVGNALGRPSNMTVARLGHILGGVPYNTGMDVINRLEASGLQAAANKAECIALGTEQVNVALGMELMSKYDSSRVTVQGEDLRAKGIRLSNEIARKFGISRQQVDQYAFSSYQKAKNAAKAQGVITFSAKDSNDKAVFADQDEFLSEVNAQQISEEQLFANNGVSTKLNYPDEADCAALLLLANPQSAQSNNLTALGKWVAHTMVGVSENELGTQQATAISRLLQKSGKTIQEIDLFEVAENSAAEALYTKSTLLIPDDKFNVQGGSIAIGNAYGATGIKQIITALYELKQRNKRFAVVSGSTSTGTGIAVLLERA